MGHDIIPYEPYHPHLGYTLLITILAGIVMLAYSKSKLHQHPRLRVSVFAACLAIPFVAEGGAYLIYSLRPSPDTALGYLLTHIHAYVINQIPIDTFFSSAAIHTGLFVLAAILVISMVRFCYGTSMLWKLLRFAQPIAESEHSALYTKLQQIADRTKRPLPEIVLLESAVPLAFATGILHPRVCLSNGLIAMLTANEAAAVVCHEWAHVIRRDTLLNWATRLLRDMLFFFPGQHVFWRSMVASEEEDCDAIAIALSGDPVSLARALVKVAGSQHIINQQIPLAVAAPFALADKSPEARVKHILAFNRVRQRPARPTLGAYALLMLFAVLALLPALLGS